MNEKTNTMSALWDTSKDLGLLHHFMMVGAEKGETEEGLSINDHAIYRDIVNVIGMSWDLPNLLTTNENDRIIDIVNMHEEHGGRDFLKQDMKHCFVDVLALCHIPEDIIDTNCLVVNDDTNNNLDILKTISNAFCSSVHHNDKKRWKSQIEETKASIVFIYGVDSFDSSLLNDSEYIKVPYQLQKTSLAEEIFIRKSFLEACHDYLFDRQLSLLSLANDAVFGGSPDSKKTIKPFQLST